MFRKMQNAIGAAALVALLLMLATTAVPAPTAEPADDGHTIVIKDFHFTPMSLAVKAGTTVSWKNEDEEPHTVVSDAGLFRSGALDEHEAFTFKFDRPGTYGFVCSIHPHMTGTIIVE